MNPSEENTPHVVNVIAIVIMALMSLAFVYAGDRILPTRIDEGPLVQIPEPGVVTLVWYTTQPADVTLEIEGVAEQMIQLDSDESRQRHVARLRGLAPASEYPYRISLKGGRKLFEGELKSPKPAGAATEFIVFGDSGKGTRVQYALGQQMLERNADFMLHTGDLVYGDGARHKYPARFFGAYRQLISSIPFFPCLGNHDVAEDGSALPYASVFELPQNGPASRPADHEYWFDYGQARIVVLDSEASEVEMRDVIAPWLREVFEPNAPEWRIVSLHRPAYSVGNYRADLSVRRHLVPVFEAVGVDVVFSGHDHNYQRMRPIREGRVRDDGILYIITGAGGARLYEREQDDDEYVVVFDSENYSATYVKIDGETMSLSQFTTDGELIDEWEFKSQVSLADTDPADVELIPETSND